MKRIAASAAAFALVVLTGIASASACDFMDSTAYYEPAPAPVVTASERQMIMSYLDELSAELAA
jgi:hypothetical protein